ncbi:MULTISPECIES: LysM peptidoglycan-binding domain-containing protein [unclassified Rathayibacter]|uniref:LysM peptidoglycan-binding domain-containing protein n=1 Tax=unclassified Rathayibacter TaxID=2609250 RepID=UPI00188B18C6|nr:MULTISPECIES: LysM peptidoglycan-binding domain-containing protein [unclassified Rathayibacter]MBF4463583.1 LysM peptidoglycan-binding domain-containing protein [Rathayibacter sp. VKM Ac-2879]MBF4504967.1 LysM peptidoglycan-binding domain-containing protein [Rathayibacter sp. VKM Ac-2878]
MTASMTTVQPIRSSEPLPLSARLNSADAAREGARAARTRLRLTRRGRVVLGALAALPIIAGAFVLGLNGGGAVASSDAVVADFPYVTVHAGESLWSLAETLAPHADPRDVVDDIVSLNQLQSACLEPGQRLAIPAQYAPAG